VLVFLDLKLPNKDMESSLKRNQRRGSASGTLRVATLLPTNNWRYFLRKGVSRATRRAKWGGTLFNAPMNMFAPETTWAEKLRSPGGGAAWRGGRQGVDFKGRFPRALPEGASLSRETERICWPHNLKRIFRNLITHFQLKTAHLPLRNIPSLHTFSVGAWSYQHAKNDFVTVRNFCDTDNRALFLYRQTPYMLK